MQKKGPQITSPEIKLQPYAFHKYKHPNGEQADANFATLKPKQYLLKSLTDLITHTYQRCNGSFKYSDAFNPRRVLTKNCEPVGNDGYDNGNADYILFVNETLGSYSKHQYQVLDMLGQGTFGQVVKARNIYTKELVAIKVVKNKPAYFNQGLVEIQILEMLNHQHDAEDKHHIVRLEDYFVFRNHLCLVFELLSVNLYELLKQNQFRGLPMTLIRCFLIQMLDALRTTASANVIHCDLKPENILLENLTTPNIKMIDFGSACFENQTVYSYIQSRFYRSPEVLIGVKYTSAIDMWSLGCIAAELFLGIPLFPGTSEFNQLWRIIDMVGDLPQSLLSQASKASKFFNRNSHNGTYSLKAEEEYAKENGIQPQPSKKYFKFKTLPEIIEKYAMKQGLSPQEIQKEKENRASFADFLRGLLALDPDHRWDAEQARKHPFISGEPFTGSFKPEPKQPASHTPPRIIPWGIRGTEIAQPQRPISMSYPEPDYFQDSFSYSSLPKESYFPAQMQQQYRVPPLPLNHLTPPKPGPFQQPGMYPSPGGFGLPSHTSPRQPMLSPHQQMSPHQLSPHQHATYMNHQYSGGTFMNQQGPTNRKLRRQRSKGELPGFNPNNPNNNNNNYVNNSDFSPSSQQGSGRRYSQGSAPQPREINISGANNHSPQQQQLQNNSYNINYNSNTLANNLAPSADANKTKSPRNKYSPDTSNRRRARSWGSKGLQSDPSNFPPGVVPGAAVNGQYKPPNYPAQMPTIAENFVLEDASSNDSVSPVHSPGDWDHDPDENLLFELEQDSLSPKQQKLPPPQQQMHQQNPPFQQPPNKQQQMYMMGSPYHHAQPPPDMLNNFSNMHISMAPNPGYQASQRPTRAHSYSYGQGYPNVYYPPNATLPLHSGAYPPESAPPPSLYQYPPQEVRAYVYMAPQTQQVSEGQRPYGARNNKGNT